jgi:hypothetical protein
VKKLVEYDKKKKNPMDIPPPDLTTGDDEEEEEGSIGDMFSEFIRKKLSSGKKRLAEVE